MCGAVFRRMATSDTRSMRISPMPRGQTAHLLGKRTGRPKGTGHRSRLRPDLRWAYQTIADPQARPPTAGAQYCKDLALGEPEKFLALLGDLEAQEKRLEAQENRPTSNSLSHRLKTLTI